MAIAYQCLILHDSGNSGPGDVVAAGYTDLTDDGNYNPGTSTIRTDSPRPAFTTPPDNNGNGPPGGAPGQHHRWNGSAFGLSTP